MLIEVFSYVENQAASDAVADMKNFPLGGSGDTCVTVDFIKLVVSITNM